MPEVDSLPANVDAERSILGAILLEPKAFDEAASAGMVADDFFLDSHKRIYRRMEELAYRVATIETGILIDALRNARELSAVGDVGFISDLIVGVPYGSSVKHYVRIVKEKAAQRRVIRACNAAVGGIADQMSSSDAMEYLQDQMLQIQTGTDEAPAERVLKFSDRAYAKWLEVANGAGEVIGLPTGVPSLDQSTTGIRPGEQWAVGARTGCGKTNFCLQVAGASCVIGKPVGIFSLEMPRDMLLERLWAQHGRIPFQYIRYPRYLSDDKKREVEQAMLAVGKWPLYIADEASMSLSKAIAKARLLIRKEKIELLVVDYIQKMRAPGKDERTQITKISEAFRALAKDSGVPTLLLSQLSRPDQANRNKRPTKFDLKESGSLENDANVVLLIHRYLDELNRPVRKDEIIVDKQRSGEFSIELVTLNSTMRFEERPADHEARDRQG